MTYLGEITLGGVHDPFPPFDAFPAGFFVAGWATAGKSCDILTGMVSLGRFCCLQTLKKQHCQ